MPELPEVETIVSELKASKVVGKKILKVEVLWNRTIATPSTDKFLQAIENQKIKSVFRRGKRIVFELSKGYLFVHLRMTGKFLLCKPISHECIRLYLEGGEILYYVDQRKFGRFSWSHSLDLICKIGVEPFSEKFTVDFFRSLLKMSKRSIKPFLLDQKYVCGLGNIYVDEALWQACIHPLRQTDLLADSEICNLHAAILDVLERGIRNQGTSLGNFRSNYFTLQGKRGGNQYQLYVFRREGKKCSRCEDTIIKIKVHQRGTHLCPTCQI